MVAAAVSRPSIVPVVGFPGYLVSDLGCVFSLWHQEWVGTRGPRGFRGSRLVIVPDDPRPLADFDRKDTKGRPTGYRSVCLSILGRRFNRYLHDLVLSAFVGPRPSANHDACHGDGNRANNALSNLRWDTKRGNTADRIAAGTQHVPSGWNGSYQPRGDTWRMARGIVPRALAQGPLYVGPIDSDSDGDAEPAHAFADLLGAAE